MEFFKFIFEYDGKLVINNELTVEVSLQKPIAVNWFFGNDLIIETHEKFILNTNNLEQTNPAIIIKIDEHTCIVRPYKKKSEESLLTIIASETISIFPKHLNVQLASNDNTTFLTVADKDKKIAYDMGGKIESHKIEINNHRIVIKSKTKDKYIFLICNTNLEIEHHIIADNIEYSQYEIIAVQSLNTVLGHAKVTKFDIKNGIITFQDSFTAISTDNRQSTLLELPFAFLQCIKYKDFENAKSMISFEISDEHLEGFFGDFEILLNNYLDKSYIISVVKSLEPDFIIAKNIAFHIENNKIINIS